ncbi:MAG TPA: FHA domain-containing protein [Myxococcota bacterium]|nr:FHA domain-containing protein [Myxococcota bacterium]
MSWWRRRRSGARDGDAPTLRSGAALALVVVEGADRGALLGIAYPEVEIGRGEETSARDGRVRLRDRSVSSRQARLHLSANGWVLEHLATAANPTLVNGEAVTRRGVGAGDRIRIGRVMLEIRPQFEPARAAEGGAGEHTELVRLDAADPSDGQTTLVGAVSSAWGQLAVLRGPGKLAGARFPLAAERIRLGRQPDCDVVLLDPSISRLHAELVREGGRVLLRNRSQTNPTLHNGAPVARESALAHGDEIGLADVVRLRLELAGAGEEPTLPRGGLRRVMEARVDLEDRLEREFVRDGSFLDVDVADSYGLKASEPRAERVFVSFERFRGYVADRVGEHAGRILNSNGDEVMAFFASADSAVRCARALLSALPVWNARENLLEREFRVRIGIHTGRSAVDLASGVAYSPVLDAAGHLQKSAPVGGVLISADTHAALADEQAGFEPGAELPRESLKTFVLAPERIA